jgi:Leucine-rich repeat (LRR) protein
MIHPKLCTVTVCFLLLLAFGTSAQKPAKKTATQKPVKKTAVQKPVASKPATEKPKPTSPDVAVDASADDKKVRDIVAFLEFVLNTLGSSTTSARDKDVLITQTYSKIFRDDNVQIEDDLDEERKVVTNKNIVAYLKDVDFFFKDVKFEFTVEGIQSGVNADNRPFYKVSLKRNMTGTTSEGVPVNKTIPRFVEINYNPDDKDLKIVSIYTNEFNEKEALINWWGQLSFEWQTLFKTKLDLADSVGLADIRRITALETLDLSNNKYVQTIEPLAQLTNLKSLNLSKTAISDLSPIRNLTELVELDLSDTKIKDLLPLKYSNKLVKLNLNRTDVSDISVVQKMPKLQSLELSAIPVADFLPLAGLAELVHLNLESTPITSLSPLENLIQLAELNVSATAVQEINTLKGLKLLKTLDLDSTRIANITALSSLENLRVLHASYTAIADLQPLQKLVHLERIYCDKTRVRKAMADAFMQVNPKVLVVFDSEDLKVWWDTLSPEWHEILSKTATLALAPSKEELARLPNVDSIDVSGTPISDLEPLRKLQKLRMIIAHNTGINDLSPLRDHHEITYLDVSETDVSDISATRQFSKLKVLRADKSKVQNIDPLDAIKGLERLYVDQTGIHDIIVQDFLKKNPTCLVVYKTPHLNRWWNKLPENWKDVFRTPMGTDTTSTRERLHQLVEREVFHFKEASVNDLSAFSEFVRLKELHFSGTAIADLSPLAHLPSLQSLHATASPIQRVEVLLQLTELEDLDISDTPLEELKVIGSLLNLKKLNCSGTQIKKLDPLKTIPALEYLDCSNTKVGNLDPIRLLSLKTLKCFNTKLSTREIESFKKSNPECNVVYYR